MVDLFKLANGYLDRLQQKSFNFIEAECNKGELAAFSAYAIAFPTGFLALVDTYNVLK